MNTIKILLVDESVEFRMVCTDNLRKQGFEILPDALNGEDAKYKIMKYKPDIVIMNICLTKLDANSLLRYFNNAITDYQPIFIAIADVHNQSMINEIFKNGATTCMFKPFDYNVLYSHIKSFAETLPYESHRVAATEDDDLVQQITDMIHQVGVPAHIKGYEYLRTAIVLTIENSKVINAVTKSLYPSVAKKYDTSASRVERAIRHAIEVAWGRGDIDTINQIFGYTIQSQRGKPTNSEFIAMIADNLKLKNRKYFDDNKL